MNQELRDALQKLFDCPNWENRCGPWKDLNEAMQRLHVVFEIQKSLAPTDEPLKLLCQWVVQYRDEIGLGDRAAVEGMDYLLRAWGRHGLKSLKGGVNVLGGAKNAVHRMIEVLQAFEGRIAIMEEMEKAEREAANAT